MNFIIKKITGKDGTDRQDELRKSLLNRKCSFFSAVSTGYPMAVCFGNDYLHTSRVEQITVDEKGLRITTKNSVYHLEVSI